MFAQHEHFCQIVRVCAVEKHWRERVCVFVAKKSSAQHKHFAQQHDFLHSHSHQNHPHQLVLARVCPPVPVLSLVAPVSRLLGGRKRSATLLGDVALAKAAAACLVVFLTSVLLIVVATLAAAAASAVASTTASSSAMASSIAPTTSTTEGVIRAASLMLLPVGHGRKEKGIELLHCDGRCGRCRHGRRRRQG